MKDLQYYMSLHYPITLIQRDHGGFFATHPDLSGCMAQGRTADEATANLRDSREVWIEARLEGGYPVPEPCAEEFSGRFSLRISPRLHGTLVHAAERDGISLNQLVTNVLTDYAGGRSVIESLRRELAQWVTGLFRATAAKPTTVVSGEGSGTGWQAAIEPSAGSRILTATTRMGMVN